MTVAQHPWTEARDAQLTALWADGISTAEIGRRMGTTKNAIVGRSRRLGLPTRESPIRRTGDALPPKTQRGQLRRRIPRAPKVTLPVAPAPAPEPEAPVTVFKPRAPGSCCWPLWGKGRPTHLYCGAEAILERPYCAEHAARAYTRRDAA